MKRNLKTQKIGDLLKHFINTKNINSSNTKINTSDLWLQIVGKQVFSETKSIKSQKNTLHISILNPYLKRDLVFQKNKILERIQELRPDINKIVFD